MKRRDLLQYLNQHGCRFVREGGEHSIWENPATNRRTSIPRHREIPEFTAVYRRKNLQAAGRSRAVISSFTKRHWQST